MMGSDKLVSRLKEAGKFSRRYWYLYPVSAVVDIIFFIIFSGIFLSYFIPAVEILERISGEVTEKLADTKDLMATQQFNAHGLEADLAQAVGDITMLMVAMVFLLYLTWSLFQGFNVGLIKKLSRKGELLRSWAVFFLQSLISWMLLILVLYAYLRFSLFNQMTLMSLIDQGLINLALIVLLVIVFYLSMNWMGNLSLKDYWKKNLLQPFKGKKVLVTMLNILMLAVLFSGLVWLTELNFKISLLYTLLVFLPGLTFSRILAVDAKV